MDLFIRETIIGTVRTLKELTSTGRNRNERARKIIERIPQNHSNRTKPTWARMNSKHTESINRFKRNPFGIQETKFSRRGSSRVIGPTRATIAATEL